MYNLAGYLKVYICQSVTKILDGPSAVSYDLNLYLYMQHEYMSSAIFYVWLANLLKLYVTHSSLIFSSTSEIKVPALESCEVTHTVASIQLNQASISRGFNKFIFYGSPDVARCSDFFLFATHLRDGIYMQVINEGLKQSMRASAESLS